MTVECHSIGTQLASNWPSIGILVVVGYHSSDHWMTLHCQSICIPVTVHKTTVGCWLAFQWVFSDSPLAKNSYNQKYVFNPYWHCIDTQLLRTGNQNVLSGFFMSLEIWISIGRGVAFALAQWHCVNRKALLCHWNPCCHFGQSCANQKLRP